MRRCWITCLDFSKKLHLPYYGLFTFLCTFFCILHFLSLFEFTLHCAYLSSIFVHGSVYTHKVKVTQLAIQKHQPLFHISPIILSSFSRWDAVRMDSHCCCLQGKPRNCTRQLLWTLCSDSSPTTSSRPLDVTTPQVSAWTPCKPNCAPFWSSAPQKARGMTPTSSTTVATHFPVETGLWQVRAG